MLVNAAFALGVTALAQNAPAPAASGPVAPAPSPVLAPSAGERPRPPASAPRRNRAISAEAAAALAAAAPKYEPPAPKPAPKPESELVDLREIDKPKNHIIRLDPYLVREPKPVFLSERAVHTRKGLEDIAMRRYISETDRAMNRFTLPLFGSSMEARALAMYEEEERLHNMSDLRDAGVNTGIVDRAAGAYIMRESEQTFLRSSDFGWKGSRNK